MARHPKVPAGWNFATRRSITRRCYRPGGGQCLTPGNRRAKTITNCVTKRRGDGPDTPAGTRERVARASYPSLQDVLTRVDDETIATAIRGVRDLERRWLAVPTGGKLTLVWPLARDFSAGA
jgi:hypothetical protein